MHDVERQTKEYRLTQAEIFYHTPDDPDVLQTFVWQDYDVAPKYPELRKFLEFWAQHIAGTLHSVNVASLDVVRPPSFIYAAYSTAIH